MNYCRFRDLSKFSSVLIAAVALSACGGGGGAGVAGGAAGPNELDIGFYTKAPEKVSIALNGLMNYNGKTAEQLFAMRSKSAAAHPELLKAPYKPSSEVFNIDSKAAWWGLKGYIFRGKELDKVEGVSRESIYFGNPYVLVAPEWYGSGMHYANSRFPRETDFANVFPTYVPPVSVTLYPKEKREEVVYDTMKYYNDVRSMQDGDWPISEVSFDINAYNARDFGYNYLFVDPNQSKNLNKLPQQVIQITQGIVSKKSCAEPCNDEPIVDDLAGFKIKNLPAKCYLKLWRQKPTSHLSDPDLKVELVFR